jgi:diaminohydroxyphosphoribosylaminopyrimidine deaminase/5-amino-6-(5-phosphoribosylamino)uracil reductase
LGQVTGPETGAQACGDRARQAGQGLRPDGFASAPVVEAIRAADPAVPYVVAQFGQSLDGKIATDSGESRWINGAAALDHLHQLRAAVDAVVVGIGTVMADDPRLDVRRCAGENPARVVIDPRCRISATALVLRNDGTRCIIVHDKAVVPPGFAGDTIGLASLAPDVGAGVRAGGLCPQAIIAALFAQGFRRILVEGGARTISGFIDAGVVDRLHLLVAPLIIAPLIIGSGKPGLALAPVLRLADARRPATRMIALEDGDVLFDCDLRSTEPKATKEKADVLPHADDNGGPG